MWGEVPLQPASSSDQPILPSTLVHDHLSSYSIVYMLQVATPVSSSFHTGWFVKKPIQLFGTGMWLRELLIRSCCGLIERAISINGHGTPTDVERRRRGGYPISNPLELGVRKPIVTISLLRMDNTFRYLVKYIQLQFGFIELQWIEFEARLECTIYNLFILYI